MHERVGKTVVAAGFVAAMMTAAFFGGCNAPKGLFSEDDVTTKNKMKYWDNESAQATTEARRQSDGNGFGFPTGPGSQ